MPETIAPYDAADSLTTPEHVVAYLEAVLEENDPSSLAQALGTIARAKGMAQIAEKSGRSREQLYRTLSDKGNPRLDTLMDVLAALGLRLSVQPIAVEPRSAYISRLKEDRCGPTVLPRRPGTGDASPHLPCARA